MKVIKLQEAHPLYEMAVINPSLCKKLKIQVEVEQRDEGPIPHLHCYHSKERNPRECSFIRLDKPEYTDFHKQNKKLDRKQKKEFLQVMNEIIEVGFGENTMQMTGYEFAVFTWVTTYENGDYSKFNVSKNKKLVIPDYNLL